MHIKHMSTYCVEVFVPMSGASSVGGPVLPLHYAVGGTQETRKKTT